MNPSLDQSIEYLIRAARQVEDTQNRVAEEFAVTEAFLNERDHFDLAAWVVFAREQNKEYALGYDRFGRQYRIMVNRVETGPDGKVLRDDTLTWIQLPRDLMLRAYSALPLLLQDIIANAEARLKEASATEPHPATTT